MQTVCYLTLKLTIMFHMHIADVSIDDPVTGFVVDLPTLRLALTIAVPLFVLLLVILVTILILCCGCCGRRRYKKRFSYSMDQYTSTGKYQ